MSLHVLPPPLMVDGELGLPCEIAHGVVDGAFGECLVCRRTCWTWWSAAPPSGFVPLHRERCPQRLRELWREALGNGVQAEPEAPVVSRGLGAYGRRRQAFVARETERTLVTVSARQGIALPQGFTPGPFWKPGYSHLAPWVVLFGSGAGGGNMPFGEHEHRARERLRLLSMSRTVGYAVSVVGAVLLAPDGTRVDEWGQAPVHGVTRWEGAIQLQEWRRCSACSVSRWPGSWMTITTGRCRGCQEPFEVDDPRPWPVDPPDPGLSSAPDWLGGPKKATKRAVGLS